MANAAWLTRFIQKLANSQAASDPQLVGIRGFYLRENSEYSTAVANSLARRQLSVSKTARCGLNRGTRRIISFIKAKTRRGETLHRDVLITRLTSTY